MEHKGDGAGGSPTEISEGLSAQIDSELALRLRELGRHVSPSEISDVWIFPPLPDLEGSTEFLLFTRFMSDRMRRLCAAEFADNVNGNGAAAKSAENPSGDGSPVVDGNGNGIGASVTDPAFPGRITEYGAAPSHRIPRLVAGIRKRLGDVTDPVHVEVDGCPYSWDRLVTVEDAPD
jgi:hypothetical protein